MDLKVKLFNPRRVICEAVKITEDLEKARWYLGREIERIKRQ